MASRIPPHVTLVYPEEVGDEDLLMERTAEVASLTAPFELSPGPVGESNLGGVWFRVVDPSDSWSGLRDSILGPPFTPYPVIPHITVVHPRTSERGAEALAAIDAVQIEQPCRIDEVLYTEMSRNGMQVLHSYPFTGPPDDE